MAPRLRAGPCVAYLRAQRVDSFATAALQAAVELGANAASARRKLGCLTALARAARNESHARTLKASATASARQNRERKATMEAPPPPPPKRRRARARAADRPPVRRFDVEMDGVEYDPNEEQADDDEEFVPETTGMATRGEATKAPVAPVIRRVPSHVEPEIAEARRTQKERLAKLKEFGSVDGGSGDQREKRLNYLMAQSEVFSHFMEENSDLNLGKKKSKTGRTRMTEAAEDARLMKDAQSQLQVHRVTQQPSTITATMRPYQRRFELVGQVT